MTNGTTNTIQIDKSTDLDWQTSNIESDHPLVLTTVPEFPYNFSFDYNVAGYFRAYLSYVTFTGEATENQIPSHTSDSALTLATTLRGHPPDIDGLRGQVENLATSMTNAYALRSNKDYFPKADIVHRLRTTSDSLSSLEGAAYASVLYFDIQWSWLVVPILAIVLALLFLLVTISQSHRHHIPA